MDTRSGGQAFPRTPTHFNGMTLRDWFAGQALIGMTLGQETVPVQSVAKNAALAAYQYADAMIAEREKE